MQSKVLGQSQGAGKRFVHAGRTVAPANAARPAVPAPSTQTNLGHLSRLEAHAVASSSRRARDTSCAVAAPAQQSLTSTLANFKTTVGEVPRGETAGAAIVVDEVSIQAGERDLMVDVNWKVMPGQRWGLVGSNGCGKSTLLRALCGIREVDAGTLMVSAKMEVGYLAQTAVTGSQNTVWQEARSQMTRLLQAEADIVSAEARLAEGDGDAAGDLAAAQEAFAMADGFDSDRRITNVLTGLGFRMEQFHQPASQFSGGWQMRIALARLLLGEAGQSASAGLQGGLMLLDEPTNHLDSGAIKWLGKFLRNSGGTLVVVSHDEALLQDVCDHIAEVRGRKLHLYTGSYKSFMSQRAERERQAITTAAAQQAEIDRLEAFVTKFGAKATKASAAQSKQKMADKLRAEMIDAPSAASSHGGGDFKKVTLKLPPAPPCYTDVLVLKGAAVGWGDKSVTGAAPLLPSVDLTIKKGQRVLVLGPNGAGKSTLLKALSGTIPLWGGQRKEGEGVKLGIFSQDLAQDLPLHKTALEYVEEVARAHDSSITLEKCRQALGALGVQNSLATQLIGLMSGGEKARVALAGFALVPSNVLLLDEASNHLDAATIQVLTGALQDFKGAIMAITHNRAFAESLNATHVLRVAAGQATLGTNMGLSDKDFDHAPAGSGSSEREGSAKGKGRGKGSSRSPSPAPTPAAPARLAAAAEAAAAGSSTSKAQAAGRKRTTLSWAEQQEYQKLGKQMSTLTAERDRLQAEVAKLASGSSFAAVDKASVELGSVTDKLESTELRWLELAERAGDI